MVSLLLPVSDHHSNLGVPIDRQIPCSPCALSVYNYLNDFSRFGDLNTYLDGMRFSPATSRASEDPDFLESPQNLAESDRAANQLNATALCSQIPLVVQERLKRAYLSSVQFVDELVGQLMHVLDVNGLFDQTTIIFWGDHGYKLGEHCGWEKHDNYEASLRFPFLLKPPSGAMLAVRGLAVEQLVEEIDIYPTLAELSGLPAPKGMQGESLLPLLTSGASHSGKTAVYSQYLRPGVMGYSMRKADFRYTEWRPFKCSPSDPMKHCASDEDVTPQWKGDPIGVELYDHRGDESNEFDAFENHNLAALPTYAETVAQLHAELVSGWEPPQSSPKQELTTYFRAATSLHPLLPYDPSPR